MLTENETENEKPRNSIGRLNRVEKALIATLLLVLIVGLLWLGQLIANDKYSDTDVFINMMGNLMDGIGDCRQEVHALDKICIYSEIYAKNNKAFTYNIEYFDSSGKSLKLTNYPQDEDNFKLVENINIRFYIDASEVKTMKHKMYCPENSFVFVAEK